MNTCRGSRPPPLHSPPDLACYERLTSTICTRAGGLLVSRRKIGTQVGLLLLTWRKSSASGLHGLQQHRPSQVATPPDLAGLYSEALLLLPASFYATGCPPQSRGLDREPLRRCLPLPRSLCAAACRSPKASAPLLAAPPKPLCRCLPLPQSLCAAACRSPKASAPLLAAPPEPLRRCLPLRLASGDCGLLWLRARARSSI